MSRCCSQCGSNGHNSRTCGGGSSESSGAISEFMLFGVRVKVADPMRKCVSLNNLSEYEHPPLPNNSNESNANRPADDPAAGGYASADDAVPHLTPGGRERKRGVPWTEEEHRLFLLGLEKVGKGDWRGISRNFVKTRTPTQVASHAQKYYLRKNNLNRRRRRSSLFDITAGSITSIPMEEGSSNEDKTAQAAVAVTSLPSHEYSGINGFAVAPFPVTVGPMLVPMQVQNPLSNMTVCQADEFNRSSAALLVRPVQVPIPSYGASAAVIDLNHRVAADEPLPLSLRLSLSSDQSRHSDLQEMSSFKHGDSSSIPVA